MKLVMSSLPLTLMLFQCICVDSAGSKLSPAGNILFGNKEIKNVSMASDAGEASSDDFSMGNTKMEIVDIKFSEGYQFRPWKDKARGAEWVQEEVLNASADTKDAVIWKILFHGGPRQMVVYLQNLPTTLSVTLSFLRFDKCSDRLER